MAFWYRDPTRVALFRIEAKLNLLLKMENVQMAILDVLETSTGSVEKLLAELSRELKEALAAQDPTRIQAVIDRLDAAVAANPDPHPGPVPVPDPDPVPVPDPVFDPAPVPVIEPSL